MKIIYRLQEYCPSILITFENRLISGYSINLVSFFVSVINGLRSKAAIKRFSLCLFY